MQMSRTLSHKVSSRERGRDRERGGDPAGVGAIKLPAMALAIDMFISFAHKYLHDSLR